MTPTLNEEKSALLRKWREDCRVNLLELEKKSIHVRVSVFEKIINEKTTQVNRMLCVDKNEGNDKISAYKHFTDSEQQCKFIENWNGLNTNQMRSLPKSLQEYENRAKNWLNGRRAINYAQNLFPEMILCAEHYAVAVAKKLFPDNKLQQELYGDILLYSYISGICCGRVALYDGHHRASLICENSIKKEGNLKRLLQKYFDGDEIEAYSFPKHLQDAIDYFKNKYHEKLNEFQTKYTHRQFYEKSTSSSSTANKNKPSTNNNNNNNSNNSNSNTDDNKDNSRNNDSQSIVSSRSRASMRNNNNNNNSSRNMRNNNNNNSNNRPQRRTTTSSTSQYGGDRGGSYIGSASQFRSNPMKYSNNPMENLMRTIDEANIELPPPMDHVNANNTNNTNNNNNNNHNNSIHTSTNNNMNVNRNNNMGNNVNLNNPQNINNIMMNMRNQYGLNTPTNNNMMNHNYSMQMNNHRSSVGSLVTKFNNIRRRNAFLEQEIKNYKEQQRLDHERIKLLEDQIALLQRTNSTAYDTISDDYGTRQSPSTSIQHSNSDTSNDASTFFAFNNTTNSNTASTNDDISTMEMNNLPALPMTNLTPTSNLNLKINDFPSVDSMNQHLMGNNANMFTQQQMNNINDNMNMNNNMNNNTNMNNNMNMNNRKQYQSPMPLQTLGLNFDNTSYLPSTPIPSNAHNQSLFGPIGGATGEFELDAMDYTQPIPNNY